MYEDPEKHGIRDLIGYLVKEKRALTNWFLIKVGKVILVLFALIGARDTLTWIWNIMGYFLFPKSGFIVSLLYVVIFLILGLMGLSAILAYQRIIDEHEELQHSKITIRDLTYMLPMTEQDRELYQRLTLLNANLSGTGTEWKIGEEIIQLLSKYNFPIDW